MPSSFSLLKPAEKDAVAAYVQDAHERTVREAPSAYISAHAQTDLKVWKLALREIVASDPDRVAAIMERKDRRQRNRISGFTLIELSIVLVIIGLIVGGVLAGQHLISASKIRAQVSQIEKFNQAANTFFGKYGALPGDITPTAVTQFGFSASPIRAGGVGYGDGNGKLDGGGGAGSGQWAENIFFWEDLSTNSGLIEGGFNSAIGQYGDDSCSLGTCSTYFPDAKIGNGASVYVYSGYAYQSGPVPAGTTGPNFFGLSPMPCVQSGELCVSSPPIPALQVSQAYAIDTKIDDGNPTTGNVLAQWIQVSGGYYHRVLMSSNASSPNATTCYDTSSGSPAYSISYQNGSLVNCGLSFKMQAGD